ncbi:uracil phosphoribosyltransferase-domain-containing protein [Bisporella sp. PMI_857]|nr:uracil phosphoribosyltransferase-domain-containing protein [Bisporella sp. PMI_857]
MTPPLPPNVHISTHPCLQTKLSQLRESTTSARETKALIHEISLIIGVEATAKALSTRPGPKKTTHIGYEYTTTTISPQTISLVPILRSGLGMVEAVETLLPQAVPVHHLGLFRERTTLQPVEYYNNLPYHKPSNPGDAVVSDLAILVDPIIATGGTAVAAIQTLREWGVSKVLVISILGAVPGLIAAASEWPEGTEIWVAGVDEQVTEKGMIRPGVGDVGDRLFLTIGK